MTDSPEAIARTLASIARGNVSFEDRASLEHHLLAVLNQEGVEGVAVLLASLAGHAFGEGVPGRTPGEVSFHSPQSGFPQLVIDTFLTPAVASVNVSVRMEETVAPEPDPRHTAFYAMWEGLQSGPEPSPAALEPWPRAVFLVGLLEAEVMNGGLGQYLSNTGGAFVAETLACLEAIGATKSAELLRAADRIGTAAESYDAAWDDSAAAFEELDGHFLDCGEDLAGLTADHFPEAHRRDS